MSCSDQNLDVVIDLAKHAEAIGADYIVVHAPVLHFIKAQDETLYEYYKYISEQVDIGIAMWSHPDSGYLMSPETVRSDRGIAEHRRDQVQRAARDVCKADAYGWRQDPRSAPHPKTSGSTTSSSWAGSSISARTRLTYSRPRRTAACANIPTSHSRVSRGVPASSGTASIRFAMRS